MKTQMTMFCRIILKEERQSVWVICTWIIIKKDLFQDVVVEIENLEYVKGRFGNTSSPSVWISGQ